MFQHQQSGVQAGKKTMAIELRIALVVVLICVCIGISIGIISLIRGIIISHDRLAVVQKQYQTAMIQQKQINEEYENITTPDGIEYYIRDRYRGILPGEELVVVLDPKHEITQIETTTLWSRCIDRVADAFK